MKLGGLVLYTQYFEDYLSFLVEVLELELIEFTDSSLKLKLISGSLEIKKAPSGSEGPHTTVVFELSGESYLDLVLKLRFFYYRRGKSRFLLLQNHSHFCELTDPDGRTWRFESEVLSEHSLSYEAQV